MLVGSRIVILRKRSNEGQLIIEIGITISIRFVP